EGFEWKGFCSLLRDNDSGLFSYPETGRGIELAKWTSRCQDTEKETVSDAAEETWPLGGGPKARRDFLEQLKLNRKKIFKGESQIIFPSPRKQAVLMSFRGGEFGYSIR
ncbi:hypothetical protein HispidOSU_013511, partial [Sigmodon hispidus]